MKITNLSTPVVNNINRAHSALPPIDSRIQLVVGGIFLFIFALFLYNWNSSSTNANRQVSVKDPKSKINNDESSIGSTSNSSSFHPKSKPVSKKKSEPKRKSNNDESSIGSTSNSASNHPKSNPVPKKQSQQGPGKVTKDQTSSQKSYQAQDSTHESSKSSVEPSISNDSNSSFNLKNIDYHETRGAIGSVAYFSLDTLIHNLDRISNLSVNPDPTKTIDFQEFATLSTGQMKISPGGIQDKLRDLLEKLSKDPRKLSTGHLINVLKAPKYKDYIDSMKEMIAQYHPYNSSPQEFKSKFTVPMDIMSTDKAVRMALYLLGFYTIDPKAPTIKGCPNKTDHFDLTPVDLVPTSKFIILFGTNAPMGMKESSKGSIKNASTSVFSKDDIDWIEGNITTEEHKKRFLNENDDDDDFFNQ